MLVGAGAAGAGANALGPAYQGSDTLFNVTTDAIKAAGVAGFYVGGGSGNGQSAMVGGTQQMAPMSRAVNNGACAFDAGAGLANASGIVVGLDAVDVVASNLLTNGDAGGGANAVGPGACNVASGGGLANNTTTVAGSPSVTVTNYKQVLALVYGGKPPSGAVDCNSPARQTVVNNWTNLFQNHCTNTEAACNDATHGGKLWHAFRRDDASGTSDVFATILGLSPSTSASLNNGFGASPYCNAMNWDATVGNKPTGGSPCVTLGLANQFTGPGGVPEGVCSGHQTLRCSAVSTSTGTAVCGVVQQASLLCSADGTACTGEGTACGTGGTCILNATGNGRVCTSVGTACTGGGGTCTVECPSGDTCMPRPLTAYCSTNGVACTTVGSACTAPGTGTCTASVQKMKPPPGTWGEQADPAVNTRSFSDVQPTSYQDNDPIRRPCIRVGHGTTGQGAEDVCNMRRHARRRAPHSGLGLHDEAARACAGRRVPAPVPGHHLERRAEQLRQRRCTDRAQLRAVSREQAQRRVPERRHRQQRRLPGAHHQPPRPRSNTRSSPASRRSPFARISAATTPASTTCTCVTGSGTRPRTRIPYTSVTIPVATGGAALCEDGTTCTPVGSTCASDSSTCSLRLSLNFGGNFSRIHAASTVPAGLVACQLSDATDQIGCLVQADHCSIGYAGDGSNSWGARHPGGAVASNIAPILVNSVAPSPTTVQALGNGATEYPVARKLYYNSLVGFSSVTGDELTLAKFVAGGPPAVGTNTIQNILLNDGFFTLGGQSPAGTDAPFCEDLDTTTVCGFSGNINGCPGNPAGIPTQSTDCGDGLSAPTRSVIRPHRSRKWNCSVPGATVCSSTCRC